MKAIRLSYLFVLVIIYANVHLVESFLDSTDVTLPQGKVRGTLVDEKHRPYYTFFGIPFAATPKRFQEPEEPAPWEGTLIADRDDIECSQFSGGKKKPVGQEDCLVVNIYAPLNKKKKALPVIAFIPGGSYGHGSNSRNLYDGKYLVKKKVIVVTINYRLGAFGFLCLKNKVATGNMGFKDQVAALKWINKNIALFGGDPNRVTLYGQSVGSISIGYLLFTNSVKGLVHRAIMSSGALLAPHSYDPDPIQSASKAALRLGYDTSDPEELGRIYTNATAAQLARLYDVKIQTVIDLYVYRACAEDPNVSEQVINTEDVLTLFRAFRVDPSVRVITGFLNEEGMTWASKYNATGIADITNSIKALVPHYFQFKSDDDKTSFAEDIKQFYFNNILSDINNIYDQLVDYMSDTMVIFPSMLTAEAFLVSNNTMYNYLFKFDSGRNMAKIEKTKYPTKQGADHEDDLFYFFDNHSKGTLPLSPDDRIVINALTSMWANFAKTGVPSSKIFPWQESKENLNFLKIDKYFKMIPSPYKSRIQFWKSLYEKYSLKPE